MEQDFLKGEPLTTERSLGIHARKARERLPVPRMGQSSAASDIRCVGLRDTECRSNGGDCHGREPTRLADEKRIVVREAPA